MPYPVRCYTCNALIVCDDGTTVADNIQRFKRMCCRRMVLGHVDLTDDLIRYPNKDTSLDDSGSVLQRDAKMVRVVSCD